MLEPMMALVAVLIIGYLVVRIIIYYQEEWVERCLLLAERDFNNLVSSGLSHGGRKDRVQERKEWNEMAAIPVLQINTQGYRSVAHELVEANEKELGGKNSSMGKASITAFLLRELYEGDVEAAQIKIFADTRNNNGTTPYIAPGIDELVGFQHFNPETGFPPGAGVEPWLLRRVVRTRGFPREIRMINAATNTYRDPMDALAQLIQQNI
jgi:hypothetical protein